MIKVCGHRILVKPEVEKQTASGIIIALDEHKERAASMYGEVIDIGESAWMDFRTNPWCFIGDRVIFAKYAGRVIEDEGTKFIILNDEDILAVVSQNKD